MKVVINSCYGGFGLSDAAKARFAELKGLKAFFYKQTKYAFQGGVDEYVKVEAGDDSWSSYAFTVDLGDVATNLPKDSALWINAYNLERTDPILLQVLEELGQKANGSCAKLSVVEIPDGIDYEIDEYDGIESIHEKNRSWC